MDIVTESKNPVDVFITDLIIAANLHTLDTDYAAVYRDQLTEKLMERIGLIAMQSLPQSELLEAEKLAGEENFEALMALFRQKIPNFQELLKKTFLEFREQFLASVANVRTVTATR